VDRFREAITAIELRDPVVPIVSSMNMRAPPAPQHMPLVPLAEASTRSIPARLPITLRGAM